MTWKSPFHQRQLDLGGKAEQDLGWYWFTDFAGDVAGEYQAIRNDAGLWDVSPLIKFEFKGPDAAAAVGRIFANKVPTKAGGVRYGPVLNENGTMLDEGTVYRVAGDRLFLMINTEGDLIEEHFAMHTHGMDVTIANIARSLPNVAIQGPRARAIVQRLADRDIQELGYFQFIPEEISLAGVGGFLSRTGFSGELGYEFFITDVDNAPKVWDACIDQGARPFGLSAIDIARVEAGLYVIGVDYDPGETSPYDLSFDWAIKLDGDDFVGKTVCMSVAEQPPRRYKTLVITGDLPEPGATVTMHGDDVGTVKSPVESPLYGVIALAALRTAVADDGAQAEVGDSLATVHSLPLYDPEKERPRS